MGTPWDQVQAFGSRMALMGFVMSDGLQRRSCQGQMKEDIKGSQASLLQAWYQARYSFSLFFFFFVFFLFSTDMYGNMQTAQTPLPCTGKFGLYNSPR